MKLARSQFLFLCGALVWIVFLQGIMLWHLWNPLLFVCNSGGAWPFSHLPFFGNVILILLLCIGIFCCAWKILGNTQNNAYQTVAWALIVGSGVSHAIERLTSGCVLDYWHVNALNKILYFNLGDVSLTCGALFLISTWLWEYHRKL